MEAIQYTHNVLNGDSQDRFTNLSKTLVSAVKLNYYNIDEPAVQPFLSPVQVDDSNKTDLASSSIENYLTWKLDRVSKGSHAPNWWSKKTNERIETELAAREGRSRRRQGNVVFVRGAGTRRRTSASALGATAPLLLAGGLALGFFAGAFLDLTPAVNNTNIININGTSVTNTFTPTNTATATNTNNDDDTITSNNGNTNNNARSLDDGSSDNALLGLLRLSGTPKSAFFAAFLSSVGQVSLFEVAREAALLSRKASCYLRSGVDDPSDCLLRRVCCYQFEDTHLIYGGDLLMRLSQVITANHLWDNGKASLLDWADVMDAAVKQECHSTFNCTQAHTVNQCFSLI